MNTGHCRSCDCQAFNPQYWKDNKCRDCFHAIVDHTTGADHPMPKSPRAGAGPKKLGLKSSTNGNGLSNSSNGLMPPKSDSSRALLTSSSGINFTPETKRDMIVQEIYTTEKNYVENVCTMIDCFYLPLTTMNTDFAPKDKLEVIFSNIAEIRPINQMLLEDLQKRLESWSSTQKIGDVFQKLIPFLKTYTIYTAGYGSSIATLNECEKSSTVFASILKKFSHTERCKNLDLRSFLIQPVQRIPRYNLLLEDLLRNTTSTHPDYEDITLALENMKAIASVINEAIRVNENRIKVVEIQNLFVSPGHQLSLVEPHRMFVREGTLTKICRKAPKKFKFVLFSDLILYGSPLPGSDKYLFHRQLDLETCRMEDLPDSDQIHTAFVVGSAKKSFIVIAETQQLKEGWMSDIQDQIKQHIARRESFRGSSNTLGKHAEAPIWMPDQTSPQCVLCKDEFTFFVRRHHCRACGGVVCGKCSDKKVLIPSIDTKNEVRVCDKCFKEKKVEAPPKGGMHTRSASKLNVMTL